MVFPYGDFIYLTAYVLSTVICYFLLMVIRKYHQDKPLGMQTLHGQVIAIFTKVVAIVTALLNGTYVAINLIGTVPRFPAIIWTAGEIWTACLFYLSLFSMLVSKYSSIYFSPFVAELNEETTLKVLKILLIIGPTILVSIEYTFLSNVDDMATFQLRHLGYTKTDAKLENVIFYMVLLNIFTGSILYSRIEHSAIQANDGNSGCLTKIFLKVAKYFKTSNSGQQEPEVEFGYNIKVMRVALICGFLTVPILAFQFFGGADTAR